MAQGYKNGKKKIDSKNILQQNILQHLGKL